MMYKTKSGAGQRFKALALVPMLVSAMGLAESSAVRAAVSTISSSDLSVNKGSENPLQDKNKVEKFKIVEINNYDNRTTVTIKAENLGNNLTVSGGTYTDRGKTYQAKSLQCNMKDGRATITAVFPFFSVFVRPRMTLIVNDEKISFNFEDFFNSGR